MKNNPLAAALLGMALVFAISRKNPGPVIPESPANEGLFARLMHRLDNVDVSLIKIESLVTLVKAEQEAKAALLAADSRPLRSDDLMMPNSFVTTIPSLTAPLVQTSLGAVTQPAAPPVTPGMEPAKDPPKSTPVATADLAKASGHWESRGFLGRRRAWVPDQHQVYRQYEVHSQPQQQRSGVPVLRRFGSCRGGSCGG